MKGKEFDGAELRCDRNNSCFVIPHSCFEALSTAFCGVARAPLSLGARGGQPLRGPGRARGIPSRWRPRGPLPARPRGRAQSFKPAAAAAAAGLGERVRPPGGGAERGLGNVPDTEAGLAAERPDPVEEVSVGGAAPTEGGDSEGAHFCVTAGLGDTPEFVSGGAGAPPVSSSASASQHGRHGPDWRRGHSRRGVGWYVGSRHTADPRATQALRRSRRLDRAPVLAIYW